MVELVIPVAVSVVDCVLGVSGSLVVAADGPFVNTIRVEEIPVNDQTKS